MMKKYNKWNFFGGVMFALIAAAVLPSISGLSVALAAGTDIATLPLITSSAPTNPVKSNLMLILDDSGSMYWDFMPDNAGDFAGKYGFPSSQCNGVYYNPNVVYTPPVTSTGVSFANPSFTGAWINGYTTSAGTTDLSANFKSVLSDTTNIYDTPQAAYYYTYSGTQTTDSQKDYYSLAKPFYNECNSAIGSTTKVDGTHQVNTLFTKVIVSATSGPALVDINGDGVINTADKDERQNFANWYSYYRTRLLMMKSSTGLAFKTVDNSLRVGFMALNNNLNFLNITDFDATQKSAWYNMLYGNTPGVNSQTPMRQALSTVGRLYAGKVATINGVAATDPVQYACQKNYTLVSTDGFWNGNGGKKLDGTTDIGNEDWALPRPFFDGSLALYDKSTSQRTMLKTGYTRSTTNITQQVTQLQKQTLQLQQKVTDSNVLQQTQQFQKMQDNLLQSTLQIQARQDQLQQTQYQRQQRQADFQQTKYQRQQQLDVMQQTQVTRQIKQDTLQRFQAVRQQRTVTYSKVTTQQQKRTEGQSICNTEGANCLAVTFDCSTGTGSVTRTVCVTGVDSGWYNSVCTASNGSPVTICQNLSPTTTTTYGVGSCVSGTDANGLITACTISDTGWVDQASICTDNALTGVSCQDKPGSSVWVANDPACLANTATGVSCTWLVNNTWTDLPIGASCVANASLHLVCQDKAGSGVTTNNACTANANTGVSCAWAITSAFSNVASCTATVSPTAQTECQNSGSTAVTTVIPPATCTVNTDAGVISCAYTVGTGAWVNVGSCTANASLGIDCQNSGSALVTNVSTCTVNAATGVTLCQYLLNSGTWTNVSSCTQNTAIGLYCQTTGTPVTGVVGTCTPNPATGVTCGYIPGTGTWTNVGSGTARCNPSTLTGVECRTLSDTGIVSVPSCTASDPATGPTVTCPAVATPAWVNTGTCNYGTVGTVTTACQITSTGWGSTGSCVGGSSLDVNGTLIQCQTTNPSWNNVSSCVPYPPLITTIYGMRSNCNTVTSVPSSVASCDCTTAAGTSCTVAASATTSPPYTAVTCTNAIVMPVTGVATCANDPATSANSFITTSCNTVTTGPTTLSTCATSPANGSNSYVQTTCSAAYADPTHGTSNTLADTAAYYYNNNLRTTALNNCQGPFYNAAIPATDRCTPGMVKPFGDDTAINQHMTTFTVGLGARGRMVASVNYQSNGNPDYGYIKVDTARTVSNGVPTPCSWPDDAVNFAGGLCNWPLPVANDVTTIDDLWHTAVNGHGTYFNAANPADLQKGLNDLLITIGDASKTGSAASSAAASPKISAVNNTLYNSYYKSSEWTGELISQTADITTGAVPLYDPSNPNPSSYNWSAQALLDTQSVASRNIYTNSSAGLINFTWANLVTAGLDANFKAPNISTAPPTYPKPLTGLTQFCIIGTGCLSATAQSNTTVATGGAGGEALVNFLRGDRSNETGGTSHNDFYRKRAHILGDIVSAESQYVGPSIASYDETFNPGYAAFKASNVTRVPNIYTAANDGMLHAFNAATGVEKWAYIPSYVLPRLYTLADQDYTDKHQYFVEGTPKVADVFDAANNQWKTILVGGLNGGGTGFYALDITNPAAPVFLWQFTNDNMGYSFGDPVITKQSDGNWVVLLTSGYDNCPATTATCAKNAVGDGQGHLYVLDATTGTLVSAASSDIATGEGSATAPSGLSKIVALAPVDNLTDNVYGGDLLGNLWRFTITPGGYNKQLLATFKDASGNAQPVTTKPVVSTVSGKTVVYVGTGRYLGISDIGSTAQQSFYAVKDLGQSTSYGNPRDNTDFLMQQAVVDVCATGTSNGICTVGQGVRSVSLINGNSADSLKNKSGWVLDFPLLTNGGVTLAQEMSATDAAIYSGTLLFSTSIPVGGVAEVCGVPTTANPKAFSYKVNYLTGGAVTGQNNFIATDLGAGLATAPRLFQLTNTDSTGNTKITVRAETTLSTGQKLILDPPPNLAVNKAKRLSWIEVE